MEPIAVIREAVKQVPAMKYALPVAALVGVAVLIRSFGIGGKDAVLGGLAVLAGMVLVLFFVVLVTHRSVLLVPALVLVWSVVLVSVAAGAIGVLKLWADKDTDAGRADTGTTTSASSAIPGSSTNAGDSTDAGDRKELKGGASLSGMPHAAQLLLEGLLKVPINASLDDAKKRLPQEDFVPRASPTALRYTQDFLGYTVAVTQKLSAAGTVGRTVVEAQTEQTSEKEVGKHYTTTKTGDAQYDAFCFGSHYDTFVARLKGRFGEAKPEPDLYITASLEGPAARDLSLCRQQFAGACRHYRHRILRALRFWVHGFNEVVYVAEDDTAKVANGPFDDNSIWRTQTTYRKCAWRVVLAPAEP